jgi:hypothetical protein
MSDEFAGLTDGGGFRGAIGSLNDDFGMLGCMRSSAFSSPPG